MKTLVEVEIPAAETLDMMIPGEESFDSIVSRRQEAKDLIKKLQTTVAECDLSIGGILDLNQLKSVTWKGDYVVSRREPSSPRKTISPIKLMENGVAASIIQASTVYGASGRPGVVIRKVGQKEDTVDGDYEPN